VTATVDPTLARKTVALVLAGSMLVSACASTSGGGEGGESAQASTTAPDGSALTPDEQQLREDAQTFNVTVAEGALVGAGLGILTGVLIGATTGRVDNMVRYGIVGGVTGGIMGGVDGYMTAKAQEAGNNRVRMVQSMTRDVQQDNAKLQALIDSSNRILADSQQRLADIKQQAGQKTASLDQVRSEQARVAQNRDIMQSSLDTLKERRDNYQQAALQTGGDTRQLDQEIQRLNQQIAKLEQNVVAMNEALAVSKV
jgi:hypothetical protein